MSVWGVTLVWDGGRREQVHSVHMELEKANEFAARAFNSMRGKDKDSFEPPGDDDCLDDDGKYYRFCTLGLMSQSLIVTVDTVSAMQMDAAGLKKALQSLNLDAKGTKKELAARLDSALDAKASKADAAKPAPGSPSSKPAAKRSASKTAAKPPAKQSASKPAAKPPAKRSASKPAAKPPAKQSASKPAAKRSAAKKPSGGKNDTAAKKRKAGASPAPKPAKRTKK